MSSFLYNERTGLDTYGVCGSHFFPLREPLFAVLLWVGRDPGGGAGFGFKGRERDEEDGLGSGGS